MCSHSSHEEECSEKRMPVTLKGGDLSCLFLRLPGKR